MKTEPISINEPKKLLVKNAYKVPKKQWNKWNRSGRMVFNYTFCVVGGAQDVIIHPKAPKLPTHQWKTTAWNTAWLAADAATKAEHV